MKTLLRELKYACATFAAIYIVLHFAGCSSLPDFPPFDPFPTPTNYPVSDFTAKAVVWGLTNFDATVYGQDGSCPGADMDANINAAYFINGGADTILLLNTNATRSRVESAISMQAEDLKAGDELILAYSSHGMLVPDYDGDEQDGTGQDSAICMYDNPWVDDDFMHCLATNVAKGVNVRIISDCCHSEGNFRGAVRLFQRAVSFNHWGKLPRFELRADITTDIAFTVTQLAGSRKMTYSYGDTNGGTWTLALNSTHTGYWQSWFDAAKAKMPANQEPCLVTAGPMTDAILNGAVFPTVVTNTPPEPEPPAPILQPLGQGTIPIYVKTLYWWEDRDILRQDIEACAKYRVGYGFEMMGDPARKIMLSDDLIAKIEDSYKYALDLARKNGIWLYVVGVNDNMGEGKSLTPLSPRYGDPGIPLSKCMPGAKKLCSIVKKYGPDNVIFTPVAETKTSAGREYETWCAKELKGFHLWYNGQGGHPESKPSWAEGIIQHPCKLSQTYPTKTGVINDCGTAIIQMQGAYDKPLNTGTCAKWIQDGAKRGYWIVGAYAFKFKGHDEAGIKACSLVNK